MQNDEQKNVVQKETSKAGEATISAGAAPFFDDFLAPFLVFFFGVFLHQ
jgi:hypothetical protein